jgi:hypothetical protein
MAAPPPLLAQLLCAPLHRLVRVELRQLPRQARNQCCAPMRHHHLVEETTTTTGTRRRP